MAVKEQKLPPPGFYPLEDGRIGWRWIMSEEEKGGVVRVPEGYILLAGDHPDENIIVWNAPGQAPVITSWKRYGPVVLS